MTNKVVTVAEALKIGRSSDQQVYDFLVGDLNQVINENMLPSSYTSADMGRVTSGAAMALLGKIYLTFHKWTEARNVLSQLVGRYSLMTTPEQVFDVNNKMNDEIIDNDVLQAAKYNEYLEVLFGPEYEVISALVLTRASDLYTYVPVGCSTAEIAVCSGDMLFNVFNEYLGFYL